MLQAQGVAYPAIIVRDMQASLEFYTRLGLRLLYVEPNRDDEESIVAMMAFADESGDGVTGDSFLQLVGPTHPGVNISEARLGVGSMQYLALQVSRAQMQAMFDELSRAGVQGSEVIERGYERLVFLDDPNGVLVTLVSWASEPPPGMSRAKVLARAAAIREQTGAPFIEDAHVFQAIAELSLE
jgi:catechol 2,3-dioxygenase-like lactoylglutathione lyase family enzyme